MKLFNKNYPSEELIIIPRRSTWFYYIYGSKEIVEELIKKRQDELNKFCSFFGEHKLVYEELKDLEEYYVPGMVIHQSLSGSELDLNATRFLLYLLNNEWEIRKMCHECTKWLPRPKSINKNCE